MHLKKVIFSSLDWTMLKERRGRCRGGGRGGGRGNLGRGDVYSHQREVRGAGCSVNPRGVYSGRARGSSIYSGRGMVDSNLQRRGGRSRPGSRDNIVNSRHASPRYLFLN